MITITYTTKTATVHIELPHENCGPIGWMPDGSTIRNPALDYKRSYEVAPSILYQHKKGKQ